MDEMRAHQVFGEWGETLWHRGVYLDGDFAPEDQAEQWVEELVSKALTAMADAGVEVSRGPVRVVGDQLIVELDGVDLVARDLRDGHASLSIEVILSRLDAIAADRGAAARWHFWYTGDPVGAGFFVTEQEMVTTAGVDVRELDVGVKWYRPEMP